MKTEKSRKSLPRWAVAATGAAAGFVNGFLGSGGGIILLYLFRKTANPADGDGVKNSFAAVVATVLPLCAVSAVVYSHKGMGDLSLLWRFALPALAGGGIGAYLTNRLNTAVLNKIFAVIVTVAGINMILK